MEPYRLGLSFRSGEYYQREVLMGIAAHAREHRCWEYVQDPIRHTLKPNDLIRLSCKGAIVYWPAQERIEAFNRLDIPTIHVTHRVEEVVCHRVCADQAAIGRTAVDHLASLGLSRIAVTRFPYKQDWALGVQDALNRYPDIELFDSKSDLANANEREPVHEQLKKWLADQTPPFGVIAANDDAARRVADAVLALGWRVPDDVAVLGSDDNPLVCEFGEPTLSSVHVDFQKIGYLAAESLRQLIEGTRTDRVHLAVQPTGVTMRQSTDYIPTDDERTKAALRYLRQHACEGIDVGDVVKACQISRRKLERDLYEILGHTPHAEIRRIQLEKAIQLLETTDLPIRSVARQSGIPDSRYLSQIIRKAKGLTPTAYREQNRAK